ncbi:MAG: aldo/keto reductase, partial [Gemmatimonadetes bacterium]|nr:aldo/keto reductase [Gemmatimonadota bacterium]
LADSAGALADLQREGKVRWVGLSNVSVEEIEEASAIVPVTTVQNRLNPFFREALEDGVVSYCTRQAIGFLAYSPLGGGRLNKKLPAHPTLLGIARALGVSAHVVVLAWVRSRGPTVIPIPGARTAEHARDSVTASEVELSDQALAAMDRAVFSSA